MSATFGESLAKPMACRSMDSTMMMRRNAVMQTKSDGSRPTTSVPQPSDGWLLPSEALPEDLECRCDHTRCEGSAFFLASLARCQGGTQRQPREMVAPLCLERSRVAGADVADAADAGASPEVAVIGSLPAIRGEQRQQTMLHPIILAIKGWMSMTRKTREGNLKSDM